MQVNDLLGHGKSRICSNVKNPDNRCRNSLDAMMVMGCRCICRPKSPHAPSRRHPLDKGMASVRTVLADRIPVWPASAVFSLLATSSAGTLIKPPTASRRRLATKERCTGADRAPRGRLPAACSCESQRLALQRRSRSATCARMSPFVGPDHSAPHQRTTES